MLFADLGLYFLLYMTPDAQYVQRNIQPLEELTLYIDQRTESEPLTFKLGVTSYNSALVLWSDRITLGEIQKLRNTL